MIRHCDPAILLQIKALVTPILALNGADRRAKLAELGFAVQQTATNTVLTTLPHGVQVCELN